MAQQIFLVRHGETDWSRSGQHTGRSDIPLNERGQVRAQAIGAFLKGKALTVRTSPLSRARETCRIAGFGKNATIDPDLREWDYGDYEGRTTVEIRQVTPQWSVWLSPITNGESLEQVADRARRVIGRAMAADTDVALFAHGHILRILSACWIDQPALTGRYLALDTASISVLGYERQTRVIQHWNFVP
jgi:broad specificity phosphatase PhoE